MAESREKLVYQATDKDAPIRDLVTGMEIWLSQYMEVARWTSNRQIQIAYRGFATRRYTTLERLLKRKVRRKELRVAKYGKLNLYAKPGKTRNYYTDTSAVYHWYCTSEVLVRLMRCKEGKLIPEGHFKGYGRKPEFAIQYENGQMIAVEFSTKYDTEYSGKIRGKLFGYEECLPDIEQDFNAKVTVLFVLDVPREQVKRIIEKYAPPKFCFFTDFKSLLQVPMEQTLNSPICIWTDGKEYSLMK